MPDTSAKDLNDHIADHIREHAPGLTKEWLGELADPLGVRPARLVPSESLLDHIPAVLEGIAEFVRMPVEAVKGSVVGHLRLLAQLRREQGYDISELLVEFEVLSRIMSETFLHAVESYPGTPDAVEVARLAGRMREGLAGITSATVGTYRQEEQEQKKELARRLSEFGHSLAHELKTPLNAASVAMHMLREEALAGDADQQRRFTELVIRNLKRSMDLLADVRILALSEGAQSTDRFVALREVVRSVIEAFTDAAERKGVALGVEGDIPDIDVDAVRVEIALANLVSNAIKYSDPEKDECWVRIEAGRIEEGQMEGGWRISVRDNGLGIAKEFQNNVFQRHFRAHPEAAEGTGLGLAIAEQVVVQKGGRLTFESVDGEGSTFHVDIPERQRESEKGGTAVS